MTQKEEKVIQKAEFALFIIYFFEFSTRIIGMGWK
jgi:hypothetical protein